MARGMPCPKCDFPARVVSTDVQPKITYVVYEFQNASCDYCKIGKRWRVEEKK